MACQIPWFVLDTLQEGLYTYLKIKYIQLHTHK